MNGSYVQIQKILEANPNAIQHVSKVLLGGICEINPHINNRGEW